MTVDLTSSPNVFVPEVVVEVVWKAEQEALEALAVAETATIDDNHSCYWYSYYCKRNRGYAKSEIVGDLGKV